MRPQAAILVIVLSSPLTLWAQAPYPADLHAWFKSDAGVSVVEDKVTQWVDQTASGFVFTPPATGPDFVADSVNGLPAVTFDGTVQLDGGLGAVPLSGASIFAVFRYTVESSDNDYLYTLGVDGASGSQMALSRISGAKAYHYDGATQHLSGADVIPANQWLVSAQMFGESDPADHDLYVNSSAVLRSVADNSYSADVTTCVLGNWTGGSSRFVGELVELLIYDRTLSESERSEVELYLRLRVGLLESFKQEAEVLSDWQVVQYEFGAQADAEWTFDLGGTRADQAINADASILLSDIDVANKVVWGEFGSGGAPDFMGFVFGYQSSREFYLFDWKKTTDSYLNFGTAMQGMRLTKFHLVEDEPTGRDFWVSDIAENTTVLRQNDFAWVAGKDYDFSLCFTPGSFAIRVWDGETILETWEVEDSTYTSGLFGYFINSLQSVRFGQVFTNDIGDLVMDRIEVVDDQYSLRWLGGEPPYIVEESNFLKDWTAVTGHLWNRIHTGAALDERKFYRIRSIGADLCTP